MIFLFWMFAGIFLTPCAFARDGLEVSGILSGGKSAAIVNGKVVKEGDAVEGFFVERISDDRVTFSSVGGQTFDVRLRSVQQAAASPSAEETPQKQGFWEKILSFFSGKGDEAREQRELPKQKNPFLGYFLRAKEAQKKAEQVAADQQRRIEEMENAQSGSSQETDLDSNARYVDQRIMEARRVLYQADSFQGRGMITSQFFQDKISLYDEAERKLQDALAKTLDVQKQTDIKEVMEDIRKKKEMLYRERKNFDRNVQQAIQAKKLLIGMTKEDVKNAIGLPDSAGKETRGRALLERWTYQERFGHVAAEAYFQDGVLVDARNR